MLLDIYDVIQVYKCIFLSECVFNWNNGNVKAVRPQKQVMFLILKDVIPAGLIETILYAFSI